MSNDVKKWTRYCPECNNELSYKYKCSLKKANDNMSVCSSCSNKGNRNPFYGKSHTDSHKKYMSSISHSDPYKKGREVASKKLKGRHITKSQRKSISKSLITYFKDNDNPMLGKSHSAETKLKISKIVRNWYSEYKKSDEYLAWLKSQDEYKIYYANVVQITHNNDLSVLENYSKKNKFHKYELDHIFPIRLAFEYGIPEEMVGSIENLRIIPMSENRSKGSKLIKNILPKMFNEYVK